MYSLTAYVFVAVVVEKTTSVHTHEFPKIGSLKPVFKLPKLMPISEESDYNPVPIEDAVWE